MFRLDVARSRAFAFCLTIFCLWLGGSTAVLAQAADAPPADPAAEEEPADSFFAETTVTATGSAIDTFLTPQPVTVIDPLDRPADNAADLLRIEPGVDVNGVGPNQSRPVIRGQRGLRILFLENGLRMNNARRQTDFGEIPALVSLGDVDQVEVVRGPASVLYGSDAIGGVLNLVTKRPVLDRPLAGTADVRYSGAGDRAQGRLGIAGTADRWSYSLAYTRRDADDYSAPDGTYGEIELADSVEVLDTGIEDSWVDAYLGFLSNDRHEFFARYSQYRADDAGFGLVDPELLGDAEDFRIRILYPFQDFDKITLGWRGSGLETPVADTVDWQVYWQRNERELVNDIDIDIGPLFFGAPNSTVESDTRNLTDLETFGSRLEVVKVAHADHVLTWGAEFWQDDSFNTDFSRTVTTLRFPFPPFEVPSVATDSVPNAPNAENRSTGVFLQDEWSVSDRFKVIGGARFQTVETVAEETPGFDTEGLDFEDDSFVYSVNLLYSLTDSLNLVGSWGTAFRAPNIVERLFNGLTPEGAGFQILNPDLQSEESENWDLGLKFRTRRAHLELFYFENEIEDGVIQYFLTPGEIAQLPEATRAEIEATGVGFVVQQRNLDQLIFEGVELAGGYRFDSGLEIGGNFSYLEGERVDSTNPPTGDSYSDKTNVYVRWAPTGSRWSAEYRLRHQGEEDVALTAGEPPPVVGEVIPSFTVHSLLGSLTLGERSGRRHTLTLGVENLTDELYAEFSNATFFRPQSERHVFVGYRLEL